VTEDKSYLSRTVTVVEEELLISQQRQVMRSHEQPGSPTIAIKPKDKEFRAEAMLLFHRAAPPQRFELPPSVVGIQGNDKVAPNGAMLVLSFVKTGFVMEQL
jgi:hypothetical protein